ncbi:MAG: hypothetical protein ACRDSP_12145 [Pseudonocardiaceae bacterium]
MDSPRSRPAQIGQQIDAALDEIQHVRDQVLTQPPSARRSLQLAELADLEAAWWEALSEHTATRVHWRAALAAREHAQRTARHHRSQAALPQPGDPTAEPVTAGVAA